MKDDLFVMLAVLAAVLFAGSRSASASAPGNSVTGTNRPTIGNGGTILTADQQFYYDGTLWWRFNPFNPAGYEPIPGQ